MRLIRIAFLLPAFLSFVAQAQSQPPLVGIGDSFGEGVQSVNSFSASQPNAAVNRFAMQMGVPFPQSILTTSKSAIIFNVMGRSRIDPAAIPADLAVSGAKTNDVLTKVANPVPATEYDLILSPYFGLSQMQIVEQIKPQLVFAWVGNDDLIGLVVNFTTLNTNMPTPIADFTAEYQELVSRLKATGAQVVLGNIPDFTKLGFLFNNDDLIKYTGTNYNLPSGYLTTFPTMLLLKMGVFGPGILKNPAYVLDPAGVARVRNLIQSYNRVIQQAADAAGFPVADNYAVLGSYASNPITIQGVTITSRYNGGAFSLDGIHPSDFGYAVFANRFIKAANQKYNLNIPLISSGGFANVFADDPYIDSGGQGRVPGRPGTGFLESIGPWLGVSGGPGPGIAATVTIPPNAPINASEFMRRFRTANGMDANANWTTQDAVAAVRQLIGNEPVY